MWWIVCGIVVVVVVVVMRRKAAINGNHAEWENVIDMSTRRPNQTNIHLKIISREPLIRIVSYLPSSLEDLDQKLSSNKQ